jgi:hypothetical protein
MKRYFRLCPLAMHGDGAERKVRWQGERRRTEWPLFKPDNAVSGLFVRAPKGWGYFGALLCYSSLIWAHQTVQLVPCHAPK